ncbi:MAG: hypothetical protein LEGION0403_FIIPPAGN_02177 [Legionella sp.]|uniref:hypothetical protein n=1 Tax=Legionella sp. TaxID=459 RepID=UPI003D0EDACF
MLIQPEQQIPEKDQLNLAKKRNYVFKKLRALTQQEQADARINERLLELIKHAETLEPSLILNKHLEWTYSMLIGQLPIEDYLKKAQEAQEKPFLGWKIFGGLMLAAGLTYIALGIAGLGYGLVTLNGLFILGGLYVLVESVNFFGLFNEMPCAKSPDKAMMQFYELKKNPYDDNPVEYAAAEDTDTEDEADDELEESAEKQSNLSASI